MSTEADKVAREITERIEAEAISLDANPPRYRPGAIERIIREGIQGAVSASSARVEKLEAALRDLLGGALNAQERDDACINDTLARAIEEARSVLCDKGE